MSSNFNLWQYKPWWCQPWSIILTGLVAIATSWLWLGNIWITVICCLGIGVWWTYFLVLLPRLIQASIEQAQSNGDK